MSGIGAVGGADRQYNNLPAKIAAKTEETVQTEPKDKVEIKKDISTARKFVERVIGSPVGIVTSAANAVGGFFGGGVAGVTGHESRAESVHGVMSGLGYVAMGAAAGAMIPAAPVIGGIAGGVVGLIFAGLSGKSGSMEKIGEFVGTKAKTATSDNTPSESKIKDTVMNFTEGAIVGTVHGGVEGFKQGTGYGAGIVSGVIEGTKGMAGALAGTYEKPEEKPAQEGEKPGLGKKVLDAIISAPRNITRTIAGTATGIVGAGLGVLDGAAQGTVVGSTTREKASSGFHRFMVTAESVLAGAGTAVLLGGPVGLGIGIGAGVGLGVGLIYSAISDHTEADEAYAKGVTDAVRNAQSGNVYENQPDQYGDRKKTVYETFRDGIEGTMTGAGAGAREGFKEAFQAGKGVVDGVFDAGKGIAKGIAGGLSGLKD
ncbi:MAG: hypothetical protein LWY06_07145 [Firmicutes bacterium]|nr:hypothetical protein [Bacillota bacterium]